MASSTIFPFVKKLCEILGILHNHLLVIIENWDAVILIDNGRRVCVHDLLLISYMMLISIIITHVAS